MRQVNCEFINSVGALYILFVSKKNYRQNRKYAVDYRAAAFVVSRETYVLACNKFCYVAILYLKNLIDDFKIHCAVLIIYSDIITVCGKYDMEKRRIVDSIAQINITHDVQSVIGGLAPVLNARHSLNIYFELIFSLNGKRLL